MWKKNYKKLTGHRWHMARVYCILDDKGYKNSLRISLCRSYCFSTTTIVARTRPDVTLYVYYLSCCICYTVLFVTFMNDVLSVVFQRSCSKTNRSLSVEHNYCFGVITYFGRFRWSKTTETRSCTKIKNTSCVRRTVSHCFWTIKKHDGMPSTKSETLYWNC